MKRERLSRFLTVFVLLFILLILPVPGAIAVGTELPEQYLKGILNLIQQKYLDETSTDSLVQSALEGIFDGLDEYTAFYTPPEADDFLATVKGRYVGIGAVLKKFGDTIVVYSVFPESPADKAGLIPGDKIIAVDGIGVTGMSVDQTGEMIKGEEGARVVLEIARPGRQGMIKIEAKRAEIKINPVETRVIENTGLIKILYFNENVEEYMQKALMDMDKQSINKIILDLRDNPGGEASAAAAVAKNFVPKGLITKLDFKEKDKEDVYYYSELEEPRYKLVVLVNGNTASASEILAGAIQDTRAGILLGTRTYGKSKVQNVIPLLTPQAYEKYSKTYGIDSPDAFLLTERYNIGLQENEIIGWVKMTTGEYYTPKGRRIDRQGLVPDVVVQDYAPVKGIDVYEIGRLRQKEKPGLETESIDVANAEKILKLLGYEIETPDLLLDNKTFQAIKKYQADKGFYSYGVLDFATQRALNGELDRLILQSDQQLAKALELLAD
ncbi:MAG: S41 family peptidase [Peptococcaceae bacterium]|jgi:carboxyl-terminal processing protease|nr:S41 family peptidase [Peptococcaceae bacterium]MDH7523764.1 S41 family peptidase [Peptococcaceae bacterium]